MTAVRAPVVAGSFYPASAQVLASTVDELLAAAADRSSIPERAVRGVVVPHAGYVYSGPVAAKA